MSGELVVSIPMTPPRECSPNRRVHWRAKAEATKTFRSTAYHATREAIREQRNLAATLSSSREIGYIVFVSWERGRRGAVDEDNVLAACKGALDGIAEALGIDDRRLHIRGVEMERSERLGITVVTLWPEGDKRA